jgi:hypothetical protein
MGCTLSGTVLRLDSTTTVTEILFSPIDVARMLDAHPSLAAQLPAPAIEGKLSDAFPQALRKTDREIYRWIANAHYKHLRVAIKQLERALAAGCRFDRFLKTRDRQQFVSLTAEVMIAEDLVHRGYIVSTVPLGQTGADLLITGRGVDAAVEIYSPRELVAVDTWEHELSDLLNYIDVPASYDSSADTVVEREIPPPRPQRTLWDIAEMLEQSAPDVLSEIRADVQSSLEALRPLERTYRHADNPLLTTVSLTNVRAAPAAGPVRTGAISYPGFGGYSPAGVFRDVAFRARTKARKQQAQAMGTDLRVLAVYLMGTKIAEDLAHPAHLTGAAAALDDIDPSELGLDLIVFVARALPRGIAFLLAIGDDARLSEPQIRELFGQRASEIPNDSGQFRQ